MADSQHSSFIPKAPMRKEPKVARTRKVYILSYVSFVLFFGTLIATAVVFLVFGIQAQKELALQKTRLEQERSQFGESSLQEVRELSLRMRGATALLNRHIAPVRIMEAMEYTLLQSVNVNELLFEKQEDNTYRLELVATAPTFNAARFQRDILSGNPVLAGAQFEEVQYGVITKQEQRSGAPKVQEADGVANQVTFKMVKYLTPQDIPHDPSTQATVSGGLREETELPVSVDAGFTAETLSEMEDEMLLEDMPTDVIE